MKRIAERCVEIATTVCPKLSLQRIAIAGETLFLFLSLSLFQEHRVLIKSRECQRHSVELTAGFQAETRLELATRSERLFRELKILQSTDERDSKTAM